MKWRRTVQSQTIVFLNAGLDQLGALDFLQKNLLLVNSTLPPDQLTRGVS